MKLIIFLSFVFIVSDKGFASHTTTKDIELQQYISECIEETERDYTANKRRSHNSHSEEDIGDTAKHISECLYKKIGVTDSEGKFNADAAIKLLSTYGMKEDEAKELIKKCTTVTRRIDNDSAYKIFKCIGQVDSLGEHGFKPWW